MYQLAKNWVAQIIFNNSWEHRWHMRLARCLSQLNFKLSLIGRGYSWMGDHLGIASC